jgi:hypothetical protein
MSLVQAEKAYRVLQATWTIVSVQHKDGLADSVEEKGKALKAALDAQDAAACAQVLSEVDGLKVFKHRAGPSRGAGAAVSPWRLQWGLRSCGLWEPIPRRWVEVGGLADWNWPCTRGRDEDLVGRCRPPPG